MQGGVLWYFHWIITTIKVIENNINSMIDYLISIPPHDNIIKPLEQGQILYTSNDIYTPIYKSAIE